MPKRKPIGCLGVIALGVLLYSFSTNLLSANEGVNTATSQIQEIRETAAEERNSVALLPTVTPLPGEALAGDERLATFAEVAALQEVTPLHGWGVVTAPVLNQRAEPTTDASVVGTLLAGTCVQLVGEQNGWYRTSVNGSESWSSAEFITPVDLCPAVLESTIPPAPPTAIPQRVEAVAPAVLPTATPLPQPAAPTCDPNYSGACIPLVNYDLNCPEVDFKDFYSVGSDPHRFDRDHDGLACES